jgi:hypothetical protein
MRDTMDDTNHPDRRGFLKAAGAAASQALSMQNQAAAVPLTEKDKLARIASGVHFGLGKVERISKIESRWPSGVAQTLADVTVNQTLTVREQ